MTLFSDRPTSAEHAPFASTYIDATTTALAAGGHADVLALLESQRRAWEALLAPLEPTMASHRYAPGKWTLAESILHVTDTERVFSYRLLRVARGDSTPLPGFDQDAWVPESRADRRSLIDLAAELSMVRGATLALVRSLDETALGQMGTASNHPVSARALVWMIAGHSAHHLLLTRERYLATEAPRIG